MSKEGRKEGRNANGNGAKEMGEETFSRDEELLSRVE